MDRADMRLFIDSYDSQIQRDPVKQELRPHKQLSLRSSEMAHRMGARGAHVGGGAVNM